MRLTLIDPTHYTFNYGLRSLASYVLSHGHEVNIVFMPPSEINTHCKYSEQAHADLLEILKNTDIVGFSFVTNYIGQATALTRFIKQATSLPIIWGGIHAMAKPEESLVHADMICMGEGEGALVDLMDKMSSGKDYSTTQNIWMNSANGIIKNTPRPLVVDIDSLPHPLYDSSREYIINNERIVPLTIDLLKAKMTTSKTYFQLENDENFQYLTMTSRGCPHNCTYCCNNLFIDLYKDQRNKLLRRRSVDNVIDEFKNAISNMPFINFISLFDDDFCATTTDYIVEFSDKYKKEINLPFKCNASPKSITKKKIDALVHAGLASVEMGLQTGSERVNKNIFKRNIFNTQFLDAAKILSEHQQVVKYYDIIIDNPFEDVDDKIATMRLLASIPKRFFLSIFSLTFYPGTELYRRALNEKLLLNEEIQVYNKRNNQTDDQNDTYFKLLLTIIELWPSNSKTFQLIIKILTLKFFVKTFNRTWFSHCYKALRKTKRYLTRAAQHAKATLTPAR